MIVEMAEEKFLVQSEQMTFLPEEILRKRTLYHFFNQY